MAAITFFLPKWPETFKRLSKPALRFWNGDWQVKNFLVGYCYSISFARNIKMPCIFRCWTDPALLRSITRLFFHYHIWFLVHRRVGMQFPCVCLNLGEILEQLADLSLQMLNKNFLFKLKKLFSAAARKIWCYQRQSLLKLCSFRSYWLVFI